MNHPTRQTYGRLRIVCSNLTSTLEHNFSDYYDFLAQLSYRISTSTRPFSFHFDCALKNAAADGESIRRRQIREHRAHGKTLHA